MEFIKLTAKSHIVAIQDWCRLLAWVVVSILNGVALGVSIGIYKLTSTSELQCSSCSFNPKLILLACVAIQIPRRVGLDAQELWGGESSVRETEGAERVWEEDYDAGLTLKER